MPFLIIYCFGFFAFCHLDFLCDNKCCHVAGGRGEGEYEMRQKHMTQNLTRDHACVAVC